ncbi:hypothetical protein [Pleionea sp. CnH1-48]|uniref:hypothetical protein n=1 Tax=Pleionea sp. CnH1-48 TaxID=2954494 RepID=UPI002097CB5E|nr:hypothetical protein [Pleionea sp. CnH1-48]MCO7224792.1 hypothetical protein [Pleionea sp. CnH1-48]
MKAKHVLMILMLGFLSNAQASTILDWQLIIYKKIIGVGGGKGGTGTGSGDEQPPTEPPSDPFCQMYPTACEGDDPDGDDKPDPDKFPFPEA